MLLENKKSNSFCFYHSILDTGQPGTEIFNMPASTTAGNVVGFVFSVMMIPFCLLKGFFK